MSIKLPTQTFYPLNDQYIEITGLKNGKTGAYLNSATVSGTLKDRAGLVVFSNLTGVYVPSSNGCYEVQIEETFNPALGGGYTLVVDAAQSNIVLHIEIAAVIKTRKG